MYRIQYDSGLLRSARNDVVYCVQKTYGTDVTDNVIARKWNVVERRGNDVVYRVQKTYGTDVTDNVIARKWNVVERRGNDVVYRVSTAFCSRAVYVIASGAKQSRRVLLGVIQNA